MPKKFTKQPRFKRSKPIAGRNANNRQWNSKALGGSSSPVPFGAGLGSVTKLNGYKDDPFPQITMKKMVYGAQYVIAVTSATPVFGTASTFKLNSIYDPYVGVTTPFNTATYGQTEMATLYNRYKVMGVLIEVDFFDPDNDYLVVGLNLLNPANYNGGAPSATSTITGNTVGTLMRRPMSWTSAMINTGEQKKSFKQYIPMHSVFNLTKLQYMTDIENTTAATNADPGTIAAMEIAICDTNSSNSSRGVRAAVRISYYTQFYQRKVLVST